MEIVNAAKMGILSVAQHKILVRVDGASTSHELVKHLLSLSSPRRKTLFTCAGSRPRYAPRICHIPARLAHHAR
jgi:hypothetical protein